MFINLIVNNKEFISIVIATITVITPIVMFMFAKRKEQNQINFERFHKNLMNGLSNQKGEIGLDEQIAIIYELRNYSKYFPVIKRILTFQINRWTKELKQKPHFYTLINEAEETIKFINKNWIKRHFGF